MTNATTNAAMLAKTTPIMASGSSRVAIFAMTITLIPTEPATIPGTIRIRHPTNSSQSSLLKTGAINRTELTVAAAIVVINATCTKELATVAPRKIPVLLMRRDVALTPSHLHAEFSCACWLFNKKPFFRYPSRSSMQLLKASRASCEHWMWFPPVAVIQSKYKLSAIVSQG